jgi:hypothetical protein
MVPVTVRMAVNNMVTLGPPWFSGLVGTGLYGPNYSHHQLGIEGDMGIWTWEQERLELEGSGTSGRALQERKKEMCTGD